MKFFDKKLKVGLATFFGMILIILEFGILDEYHFAIVDGVKGLSLEIKNLEKDLGYNFVTMSLIVFVGTLLYSMYIGYRKNWGGLIAQLVIAAAPFIGQFALYNVFFGWGTAHLLPALTLFKLHTASNATLLIIFGVIFVLYAVLWYLGFLMRKNYDAKNPF